MRKMPAEIKDVVVDFSSTPKLAPHLQGLTLLKYPGFPMSDTASISSVTVTCVDNDGTDCASMITDESATERARIQFSVNGGTEDASPYVISILVALDDGQELQHDEDVVVH
jgi:hypothetical protein